MQLVESVASCGTGFVHGQGDAWISLLDPGDPEVPGSHPTAMLLSPDEKLLYVALSNADRVAVVSTESGESCAVAGYVGAIAEIWRHDAERTGACRAMGNICLWRTRR